VYENLPKARRDVNVKVKIFLPDDSKQFEHNIKNISSFKNSPRLEGIL